MKKAIIALVLVVAVATGAGATTLAARYLIYWGHYADMQLAPSPCLTGANGVMDLDTLSIQPFTLPDAQGGVFMLYRCAGRKGTPMAGFTTEVVRFYQTDARFQSQGFGIPGAALPPEAPPIAPTQPVDCSGYPGFVPGIGGGCVPPDHPNAQR
jgi:hypothetical protein